jgi:hypothetical protein
VKTWPSLAEAAVDLKISERTAFRWLRTGRIAKRKDEDGRLVFVLTSEVIDTATTDSHDMSDSPKSVSNDTESNRTQRKRVSVESERISIALDCLKALYILRTEATSRVRSCQGAKKIKWVADEAQEGMIFWMKIERVLNNVYVGIEKGVGGKDELKRLWFDLLVVRTDWEREQSAQFRDLELYPDRESQLDLKFEKEELKKELAQFDLALKGLKQLLILAVEPDTEDR